MQPKSRVLSHGNDFTFPVGPIADIDGTPWPGTTFNAYISDTRASPVALGGVIVSVPITPGQETTVTFEAAQVDDILAASAQTLVDGLRFWAVVEAAGDFLRVAPCIYREAIEST